MLWLHIGVRQSDKGIKGSLKSLRPRSSGVVLFQALKQNEAKSGHAPESNPSMTVFFVVLETF